MTWTKAQDQSQQESKTCSGFQGDPLKGDLEKNPDICLREECQVRYMAKNCGQHGEFDLLIPRSVSVHIESWHIGKRGFLRAGS